MRISSKREKTFLVIAISAKKNKKLISKVEATAGHSEMDIVMTMTR